MEELPLCLVTLDKLTAGSDEYTGLCHGVTDDHAAAFDQPEYNILSPVQRENIRFFWIVFFF